jgi:GWxTD domain-containing protein
MGSGVRWVRAVFFAVLAGTAGAGLLSAMPILGIHHKETAAQEEKRREKAVMKEMETPYKKWLTEEVPYIITPQERQAFLKLTTDEEREQFIEQFWERRNPNPGSAYNEYKEEYYRRIAYANEHYSSGIPGWKTDRGRIYIMYGPPDEIVSHPSGGTYIPDQNELPYAGPGADTQMTTYPFETWRYRYIPGIGNNVILEFVDPTMTGEYHLTMNPCEKDAMAQTPNDMTGCAGGVAVGSIWNPNLVISPSQIGGANGQNGGGAGVTSNMMDSQYSDEFNRLDLYSKIFQPPEVQFKDLKAVVTSQLSPNLLPFMVRTDYLKVTDETVLVPITIQIANRNVEFQNKDGVMQASLDIFGQLSTLSGRIANTFDDGVADAVPQHDFQAYSAQKSVYQKIVPLRPGRYKLTVVVKDENNGHIGSTEIGIIVPQYNDDTLQASSLILADDIHPLPTSEVGAGPFNIGGTHVRPTVDDVFTPSQDLGIYMQVYNLAVDPKTHKPLADVEYTITNSKDGKKILDQTESSATIKDAAEQMTLEKQMPVKELPPGKYTIQVKVTDKIKKVSQERSATFQVQ